MIAALLIYGLAVTFVALLAVQRIAYWRRLADSRAITIDRQGQFIRRVASSPRTKH